MSFYREWKRGPRTVVAGTNTKGQTLVRTGKKGGPVVEQLVELFLVPKEKKPC